MKKINLTIGFIFLTITAIGILIFLPNPLGTKVLSEAKARGLLPYTTDEAITLAYERCGSCHDEDKITKYCARCGPPFVVVANFMKKYVEVTNSQGGSFRPFTEAELSTIVQVWNGLVGNWEADWRDKDLKKILKNDKGLLKLLETPLEKRPIEMALRDKSAPGSYKEYEQGGGGAWDPRWGPEQEKGARK